jgi:hypothetical protein
MMLSFGSTRFAGVYQLVMISKSIKSRFQIKHVQDTQEQILVI